MVQVIYQGKQYTVRDKPGKEHVAGALAVLETRLQSFVDNLKSGQHCTHPKVLRIAERWAGRLSETSQMYDREAAYTTDKKTISICVRKADGDIEDLNAAMYVLLHELSHVATPQHGHDEKFWSTFRFLLQLAVKQGLYDPKGAGSVSYCGVAIDNGEYTCIRDGTCTAHL